MMVLSRKLDESIMIGDDIEVRIVQIEKRKVRLAIQIPKHVTVQKKENYEKPKE